MKKQTAILLIVLAVVVNVFAEEKKYIKIVGETANIHFAPNTSSQLICRAKKGNIFELTGETKEWYKINLFSGEWRYVLKSLSDTTKYTISLPKEISTRRKIFMSLLKAEDKAFAEANLKYPTMVNFKPTNNIEKNIDYNRILNDRYQLEVMQKYKVHPPINIKLTVEAITKEWY